jgi:hypothetical protein
MLDFEEFQRSVACGLSLTQLYSYLSERESASVTPPAALIGKAHVINNIAESDLHLQQQLQQQSHSQDQDTFMFGDVPMLKVTLPGIGEIGGESQAPLIEINPLAPDGATPRFAKSTNAKSTTTSLLMSMSQNLPRVDDLNTDEDEDDEDTAAQPFMFGDFVMTDDAPPQPLSLSMSGGKPSALASATPSASFDPQPEEEAAFQFGDFAVPVMSPKGSAVSLPAAAAAATAATAAASARAATAALKKRKAEPCFVVRYALSHLSAGSQRWSVRSLDFAHASGRHFIACCGETSVSVVTARNGQFPVHDYVHDDAVLCVASSYGKQVATGTNGGLLTLYELTTPKSAVFSHRAPVTCLSFSFNGRFIVSGTHDGSCWLWSAKAGSTVPLVRYTEHTARVTRLECQPAGELVASGGADCQVRVWKPATQYTSMIVHHAQTVTGLAFSPDGTLLLSCSADKLVVCDVGSSATLLTLSPTELLTGPDAPAAGSTRLFASCTFAPPAFPFHIVVSDSAGYVRLFRLLNIDNLDAGAMGIAEETLCVKARKAVDALRSSPKKGDNTVLCGDRAGNVYSLKLVAPPATVPRRSNKQ